jgi:hypothetical protein
LVSLVPHPLLQAVPLEQMALPGQEAVEGPAAQFPLPSHWVSVVSMSPLQETTFEQVVPAVAFMQTPVPVAQASVCPQGGFVTEQAPEQQTPLLPQTPLVHWSVAEQVPAPLAILVTHWWLALQYAVDTHWVSLLQLVVQAPAVQR